MSSFTKMPDACEDPNLMPLLRCMLVDRQISTRGTACGGATLQEADSTIRGQKSPQENEALHGSNPHKPTGVGLVNIYQKQARTVGLGGLETGPKVSQLCPKFNCPRTIA